MTRGVRWYLVSSLVLVALTAVAGCSHYMLAEREPWRAEAELSCLNSGAVKESAARVRISPIDGPGACGITYPLRVSALGSSSALGYDDELTAAAGHDSEWLRPKQRDAAKLAGPKFKSRLRSDIRSAKRRDLCAGQSFERDPVEHAAAAAAKRAAI